MISPSTPLSEAEFDELDNFLLYEVDTEEGMTIDMMDGFLHAIAIGPTSVHPTKWLPKVWGTEEMMPPMESLEHLNHVLDLVMRHYNGIIAGFEANPREIVPVWSTRTYRGKEYDDAESWAYGFALGVKMCRSDWLPMLATSEGRSWYRPIGLLGEDDFGSDQDELTKTPAKRQKLALQIPEALMAMHAYWLPLRQAVYERDVAKSMRTKVGRNEPCPCGSGKKFKKCCGSAAELH